MPGWAKVGGGGLQQVRNRAMSWLSVLTCAGSASARVGHISNSATVDQVRRMRGQTNLVEPRTGVT